MIRFFRMVFVMIVIFFITTSLTSVSAAFTVVYSQPGLVDMSIPVSSGWKKILFRNDTQIGTWTIDRTENGKEIYFTDITDDIYPVYRIDSYRQLPDGTWEFQGRSGEMERTLDYAQGIIWNTDFTQNISRKFPRSDIVWDKDTRIRVKNVKVASGLLFIHDAEVILEGGESLTAEGGGMIIAQQARFVEYEEPDPSNRIYGGNVVVRGLKDPFSPIFEECTFGPGTGLIIENSVAVTILKTIFEEHVTYAQEQNVLILGNVSHSRIESCQLHRLRVNGKENRIISNEFDYGQIEGETNQILANKITHGVVISGGDVLVKHNHFHLIPASGIYMDAGLSTVISSPGHLQMIIADNRFGGEDESKIPAMMLYYANNASITNNVIDGDSAVRSGIGLSGCSLTTISGNHIDKVTGAGIRIMEGSNGCDLSKNTVSESVTGIEVSDSSSNTIHANVLRGNETGMGFYATYAGASCTDNAVAFNYIWGNGTGIRVMGENTAKNGFHENRIEDNRDYGVFGGSGENFFFNNVFAGNGQNASDAWDMADPNLWGKEQPVAVQRNIVGGPMLGGNFWQHYPGADADGDGLGDVPYLIPLAGGGATTDPNPLVPSQGVTQFSLTPASVDLGRIRVRAESRPAVCMITNGGEVSVQILTALITNPSVPGFHLVEDTCAGKVLPPGGQCTLSLTFTPQADTAETATLQVITTTPGDKYLNVQIQALGAVPPSGDYNEDLYADLKDLFLALEILTGSTSSGLSLEWDPDQDGRITSMDGMMILQQVPPDRL